MHQMANVAQMTHGDVAKGSLPSSCPYDLIHFTSSSLSEDLLESCFNLIEQTSSSAYKASSKGWCPADKKTEMRDIDMHYLLLLQKSATEVATQPASAQDLQGFLSYMLTVDDSVPVIYVYEVHLKPTAQGHGFGKALMTCVEAIGRHESRKKAMLTVFVTNVKAIKFYECLGYEKWDEEYIPRMKKKLRTRVVEPDRKPTYIIMAKNLSDGGWETDGSEGSSQACEQCGHEVIIH
jgi:ribosomal protein S18 acetylase RimI-like enzyme